MTNARFVTFVFTVPRPPAHSNSQKSDSGNAVFTQCATSAFYRDSFLRRHVPVSYNRKETEGNFEPCVWLRLDVLQISPVTISWFLVTLNRRERTAGIMSIV